MYLAPAAGSAAITMLNKKVGCANLVLGDTGDGPGARTSAVVGGHVVLELLGVGACRGLPSRDLVGRVEVVGEVLGIGVTDFPVGRQPGFSLTRGNRSVSKAPAIREEVHTGGRTMVVSVGGFDAGQWSRSGRSE